MSAGYRFQQGVRALSAWLRPVEDEQARKHLTPALYMLYTRMRRSERQHSLRVLHALLAEGHTDADLLTAGLLHDVGKTRAPFSILEKVLVVLTKAIAPSLHYRWGRGVSRGWRRPFAVSVQHPDWGADMVRAAGGSPVATELVRRHAEQFSAAPQTHIEHLLVALQSADDDS